MAQLLVFGTYQTYHKSSGGRMDFSSLPRSWQVAVVRWCRNPSNHTDKGRATIGNSVDGSREKFGPNPSKSLEEKSIPKKIQQGLLYCCTKWIQNEPKKKMAKRPDWYCRCCQCSPVFVEIIIQPVLYAQVGSHLACKNYGCPYFKSHPVPTWFCIPRSSMIFQEKPWPDLIFFFPTAPEIGIGKIITKTDLVGGITTFIGMQVQRCLDAIEERSKQFQAKVLLGAMFCCKTCRKRFRDEKKTQVLKVFSKLRDWHQKRQGMTKFNFVFGVSNSTLGRFIRNARLGVRLDREGDSARVI